MNVLKRTYFMYIVYRFNMIPLHIRITRLTSVAQGWWKGELEYKTGATDQQASHQGPKRPLSQTKTIWICCSYSASKYNYIEKKYYLIICKDRNTLNHSIIQSALIHVVVIVITITNKNGYTTILNAKKNVGLYLFIGSFPENSQ